MFPYCAVCSQAEAAALQSFKQEVCRVRGRDMLTLWCHNLRED